MTQADFDLSDVNKSFILKGEKQFIKQNLVFPLENDKLTLFFNLFIEKSKIELDQYVMRFKEEEK